jgi:heptosyltransferase-2
MSSILVRSPNWIGDQVLAYPFHHYLRQAYPSSRITAVCVPWVEDLQFRNLVDEVVVLEKPAGPGLLDRFRVLEDCARRLRAAGPWDLAFSLPNSFSAAWLLYRAGARRRRGYRVDGRGLLLDEAVAWDPSPERHRAQAYVDLLPERARPDRPAREFWGIPPENDLEPGVEGVLERFDAPAAWRGFEPVQPPAGPYWVLAPGATAESRRWPLEYFVQLASRVREQTGWTGAIVGGPKEAPLADELGRDARLGLVDYTARGPVPVLSRLFAGARFTVCNESGLAHVAALCGSPVQIVCGAADPRRTRPLGPGRVQVAINPVECWPCERNFCDQPPGLKIQCLRGIAPESIWEEIRRGIRA